MTTSVFASYQNWLKNKNYSDATIRNYLVDLKKYFNFCNPDTSDLSDIVFNENKLSSYLETISRDQNYKRFQASLSKFFQYAIDQHLISINPFNKIRNVKAVINTESILKQYQQELTHQKFSFLTIKNYINDIRQFINWTNNGFN